MTVPDKVVDVFLHSFVHFQLETKIIGFHGNLSNFLSFQDEKLKYSKSVRNGSWDGRIPFYDKVSHKLPTGLLSHLLDFCRKLDIKINFKFDQTLIRDDLRTEELDRFHSTIFLPGFQLRDYQREGVLVALNRKMGVVCASTSSGKSAQIYAITRFLLQKKGKILIIVPTVSLVEQLFENFVEYGWGETELNVCKIYSGNDLDTNKRVFISTYHSIVKESKDFFETIEVVIVDEAHGSGNASIQKILKRCVFAEYRIGFTGTLPRKEFDRIKVVSLLGPKIYEVRTEALQELNFVAKCRVINFFVNWPKDCVDFLAQKKYEDILLGGDGFDFKKIPEGFHKVFTDLPIDKFLKRVEAKNCQYLFESDLINSSKQRMAVLCEIFKKIKPDQNILIMVQELEHFENVYNFVINDLELADDSVFRISGDVSGLERERIRKMMEQNRGVVLVATFGTMSTGVSITTIDHVILLKSFRSEIRTLQTIGRGLRLNPKKDFCLIWDVVDDLTSEKNSFFNFCFKHWAGKLIPGNDFGRLDFYKEQKFPFIGMDFQI